VYAWGCYLCVVRGGEWSVGLGVDKVETIERASCRPVTWAVLRSSVGYYQDISQKKSATIKRNTGGGAKRETD